MIIKENAEENKIIEDYNVDTRGIQKRKQNDKRMSIKKHKIRKEKKE